MLARSAISMLKHFSSISGDFQGFIFQDFRWFVKKIWSTTAISEIIISEVENESPLVNYTTLENNQPPTLM